MFLLYIIFQNGTKFEDFCLFLSFLLSIFLPFYLSFFLAFYLSTFLSFYLSFYVHQRIWQFGSTKLWSRLTLQLSHSHPIIWKKDKEKSLRKKEKKILFEIGWKDRLSKVNYCIIRIRTTEKYSYPTICVGWRSGKERHRKV